jgi:hypothetical protein
MTLSLMDELDAAFRTVQRLLADIETEDGSPAHAQVLMVVSLELGDPQKKVIMVPNGLTKGQAQLELEQTIEILKAGKERSAVSGELQPV